MKIARAGQRLPSCRLDLPRAGPARDVITAEVVVTFIRTDKPVTTLSTTITKQNDVVVLDGTAVVWRDPAVANG